MRPELFVILDDREVPPAELAKLIGNIHFGEILRRRRRFIEELIASSGGAKDTIVLRSSDDLSPLVRRIENARGDTLWLRLPVFLAPLDMPALDFLIRKVRYALEPISLSPIFEDDAPMLLYPQDAIALVSSPNGRARRSLLLRLQDEATLISHDVNFVDLREPEGLRQFLSGATEPRGFNNLSADQGIFTKSSTDISKMKAEHDFFSIAPAEMQRFLMPTFGYDEQDGVASYKMEHLRIPDAALQFVLGAFNEFQFDQLIDQFFAFIASQERKVVGRVATQKNAHAQIIEKMHDRLLAFARTPQSSLVNSHLKACGVTDGISGLEKRASSLVQEAILRHKSEYLTLAHGDPCLSNILFDSRIGLVRFIDPKGAKSREEAFMHPLYDIAKLSHSVCGGYDFVNNASFNLEVGEDLKIDLQFDHGGPPSWVKDSFSKRLLDEGWVYKEVRSVEATLFLSMLPLHIEHPQKLLGFSLIAHEIIKELEDLE